MHVANALAALGPRFAGTSADAQAADLMVQAFRAAGVAAQREPFTLRGWLIDAPATLQIRGPNPASIPCATMIRSGAGVARGTLRAAGLRPVIGVFEWESFHIVDADGAVVGLIVQRDDGPPIPQCLDEELEIPAVVVGHDWLAGYIDVPLENIEIELVTQCHPVPAATSYNVVSELVGRGEDDIQAEILVCAHHDSMYNSPGANDNASGAHVIAQLAAASLDLPPGVGVRFVSFSGEEWILLGSEAYLATRQAAGDLDRIKLVLNIDMVGSGDYLWPSVTDVTEPLFRRAVAAAMPDFEVHYHNPPMKGDHYPFHVAGIPAIMLLGWPDAVYHTPDDVAAALNPAMLDRCARLARQIIELAAQDFA